MAVPTQLSDLNVTAASNSPASTDTLSTTDDYIRALSSILARISAGTDVLSAAKFLAGASVETAGGVGLIDAQTSTTGIGNGADATDDTLFTYDLPANALSANGKSVRIHAWGNFAGNTNLKNVKPWFAGTAIQTNQAAFNGTSWVMDWEITRINATKVSVSSVEWVSGQSPNVGHATNLTVSDLTGNASTIKITGASASSAANDILGYGMTVVFMN